MKDFNRKDYVQCFEMVELTIPAGVALGQAVSFNTIPQLRNQLDQTVLIQNIEVFPVTSYGASQVTAALAGMPVAEIPKTVLTLYVNGWESIKSIPLAKLAHIQDGTPSPFQQAMSFFDNLQNVDWDKSYVRFNAAAAGTPYVIPFGISYLKLLRRN